MGGPVLASSLLRERGHRGKLSCGCAVLDAFLGGGIDHSGITEVAGEAGSGKSQFVLQLMLSVQLPASLGGLGGGAIYMHADTPSYLPAVKRLKQIAAAFAKSHSAHGATEERLMNQISIIQIDTAESLEHVIVNALPGFLREKPVRLIVLDSIGALFRAVGEDGGSSRTHLHDRAQQLFAISARLKRISDSFNVAIVITNQARNLSSNSAGAHITTPLFRFCR